MDMRRNCCASSDLDDPRLVAHSAIFLCTGFRAAAANAKRIDRAGRAIGRPDLQQRRAARWVERHLIGRFDVHHSHLFGADWLFTRLKRRHPAIRFVSTLHGDYTLYDERAKGTETSRVLHWHAKLAETIRAVDRWVTISRAQHRQFEETFEVDPARLVAIPTVCAPAPIRANDRPQAGVTSVVGGGGRKAGVLVEACRAAARRCGCVVGDAPLDQCATNWRGSANHLYGLHPIGRGDRAMRVSEPPHLKADSCHGDLRRYMPGAVIATCREVATMLAGRRGVGRPWQRGRSHVDRQWRGHAEYSPSSLRKAQPRGQRRPSKFENEPRGGIWGAYAERWSGRSDIPPKRALRPIVSRAKATPGQ